MAKADNANVNADAGREATATAAAERGAGWWVAVRESVGQLVRESDRQLDSLTLSSVSQKYVAHFSFGKQNTEESVNCK